jgi:acylpyruvate hydrolase
VVDLNRAYRSYARHEGDIEKLQVTDALVPPTMKALLNGGRTSREAAGRALEHVRNLLHSQRRSFQSEGILFPADHVQLMPPILNPGKVICVGLNYPDPEQGRVQPAQFPEIFLKVSTSLLGHDQPIILPRVSERVLCEGELAVVMGGQAKSIGRDQALSFVAGYTIANDLGARDLERRTSQWSTGKLFDTFLPLGPAIVTADEVQDPGRMRISTFLNGRLIQDDDTSSMIFEAAYLVSYLSDLTRLVPGDIILTGSPKTLRGSSAPRVPLKAGDVVEIRIQGLGALVNRVIEEQA